MVDSQVFYEWVIIFLSSLFDFYGCAEQGRA